MKELKCPKCGSVFTVDESDYADIVNQVKNAEFNAEVDRRIKELEKQQSIQQQADELKAQQQFQTKQLEFKEQLAEKAGLQRTHVGRIEAGKYAVTLEVVQAIAEALGMTVDIIDPRLSDLAPLKTLT